MLARDYAIDALAGDLDRGIAIDLVFVDGKPGGFAAYGLMQTVAAPSGAVASTAAWLSKLYLQQSFHGRGIGSMLLQHVCRKCGQQGALHLRLGVNKHNRKAIKAYKANGFLVEQSILTAIGDGYYMDDYVMGKALDQP